MAELSIANNQVQTGGSTTTEMMISRQAQEVQGAIIMAKKFPRDEFTAIETIKRACERPTLAEQAIYNYPRGGQNVTGPSIRLAEAIAKTWGNIDYGIIELEQANGSSEMMAYAWDLETNTRVTKVFKVEHKRDTKKGSYALTDSRDIYEATANFGTRRLRACILSVIPGDVVDMALQVCKTTREKAYDGISIQDKIKQIEKVFKKDFKVTKGQLEEYLGMNLANMGNEEFSDLWAIYCALRDGHAKVEDYFKAEKPVVENVFINKTENSEKEEVKEDKADDTK